MVYSSFKFRENGPLISQNIFHTHLGHHFQRDAMWTVHKQSIHKKATKMWTVHKQSIHEKATKRLNILRILKYKVKPLENTCQDLYCIY